MTCKNDSGHLGITNAKGRHVHEPCGATNGAPNIQPGAIPHSPWLQPQQLPATNQSIHPRPSLAIRHRWPIQPLRLFRGQDGSFQPAFTWQKETSGHQHVSPVATSWTQSKSASCSRNFLQLYRPYPLANGVCERGKVTCHWDLRKLK